MKAMIHKASEWLGQLNPRERRLVIGAGVFVLIFFPYQLIWAPFSEALVDLDNKLGVQHTKLSSMQRAADEVRQLRGAGGRGVANKHQPLLSLVETTARRNNLGAALKKLQPEGQQGVRVQFEDVVFDDVMVWLDSLLTKQGIVISEIFIQRQAGVGKVDVRLVMERS